MIHELSNSYTTKSAAILRAVESHREWMEARLGVPLSEAVILQTEYGFHNAAVHRLLGYMDPYAPVPIFRTRLEEYIESAQVPASLVPILDTTRHRAISDRPSKALAALLQDWDEDLDAGEASSAFELEWEEGPIALRLKDVPVPVVALPVRYHSGPDSSSESQQDVVIIPRHGVQSVVTLLKKLMLPDGRAMLKVGGEGAKPIARCDWDQLTLDPSVVSLLKNDFETFFEREDWFRKMRLPFRRGYLLHGPPGNGKSTAIRAMLTARALTAHTIRFLEPRVDDSDLERLFYRAAQNAPSMIMLEDIDRVFPRGGNSKTQVSLQQLLNCLDGGWEWGRHRGGGNGQRAHSTRPRHFKTPWAIRSSRPVPQPDAGIAARVLCESGPLVLDGKPRGRCYGNGRHVVRPAA